MSDALVSPDRDITIGKLSFTLSGSFQTLKALQHAFRMDLLPLQASILHMRQDEIAGLVAIASGKPELQDEIGQAILDELDVSGADYRMLKAELLAWLAVAMTPKRDREKKARDMARVIGSLKKPASRGKTTRGSASAS